ncbi:MAG: hypothetical protein AUG44_05045 [Actinobacteria bacterium 13_1_20CM_3_71_11]|nr:MAG: hypothetical protein AUG44_05045 [Actinobacteria bacterium 13_1_20CM_3_71_11]
MSALRHIDVHHHILPDFYLAEARAAGLGTYAETPWPDWSPDRMLAMLDEQRIAAAVVSMPPPGVCFVGTDRVPAFARPLPMTDVDATLDELAYVLDVLGLDGVALYSNVEGRYLGHPDFEPVFAELDRRGALAYLHPAVPPVDPAPEAALPSWCGEFVFDTTRALADLVLSGRLARSPGLRLIVAHAGGTAPYIINRLTNAWRELPGAAQAAPEPPPAYLARLYYDTASCGAGHGLRLLRDLVGTERILVGSDFPFVPAHSVATLERNLADPRFLGVTADALRANALRLLPRFAGADVARLNRSTSTFPDPVLAT